jgi:hypothetical protein
VCGEHGNLKIYKGTIRSISGSMAWVKISGLPYMSGSLCIALSLDKLNLVDKSDIQI